MDLDELRAFIAVVDNGSFKAAASALGQPRGTLRRRVSALEARARIALLERSRSGATSTRAGVELLRHGRQIVREADTLTRSLRAAHSQAKRLRVLRVGLPLGFPPEGLQMFCAFASRVSPNIKVELRFFEEPTDALMNGLDLAWSFRASAPDKRVLSRPIVACRSGLVASRSYLARHGTPQTIAELDDHRLLSWVHDDLGARTWPLLRGGSMAIAPGFTTPDFQMVRRAAARDGGIALLPDVNLPRLDPEDRKLVRVLADEVGHAHQLYIHVHPALVECSDDYATLADLTHRFVAKMVPPGAIATTNLRERGATARARAAARESTGRRRAR